MCLFPRRAHTHSYPVSKHNDKECKHLNKDEAPPPPPKKPQPSLTAFPKKDRLSHSLRVLSSLLTTAAHHGSQNTSVAPGHTLGPQPQLTKP